MGKSKATKISLKFTCSPFDIVEQVAESDFRFKNDFVAARKEFKDELEPKLKEYFLRKFGAYSIDTNVIYPGNIALSDVDFLMHEELKNGDLIKFTHMWVITCFYANGRTFSESDILAVVRILDEVYENHPVFKKYSTVTIET